MTSENLSEAEAVEPANAVPPKAVDDQSIDELVRRAQAGGLQLTGEGGLLQQLTKRLLEPAPEGEIPDHLGYDKHDPAGKNGTQRHPLQDGPDRRATGGHTDFRSSG
jgi:putative transposase